MTIGVALVAVVGLLQAAAAAYYLFKRDWPQAMVWGGAALISAGMAWIALERA